MCWLRVCAWLRVKIKAKGTSGRIVLWCKLDHRTRQFLMCWLRVYAWLRVKIKAKGTSVRIRDFKQIATAGANTAAGSKFFPK